MCDTSVTVTRTPAIATTVEQRPVPADWSPPGGTYEHTTVTCECGVVLREVMSPWYGHQGVTIGRSVFAPPHVCATSEENSKR